MASRCHLMFSLSHLVVGARAVGLRRTERTHIAQQDGVPRLRLVTSSMGRVLALNVPAFLDLRDVMVVNIYKLMKQ